MQNGRIMIADRVTVRSTMILHCMACLEEWALSYKPVVPGEIHI